MNYILYNFNNKINSRPLKYKQKNNKLIKYPETNNNKELNSGYYDNVFKVSTKYSKQPEEIKNYYTSWKYSYNKIKNNNIKYVIDIGCGPGHQAVVLKNLNIDYLGIDFSTVAIEQSKNKLNNNSNFNFECVDALKFNYIEYLKLNNINIDDLIILSFEFLEHIVGDIDLLKKLPSNCKFCFGVPNYDSKGHVRYFISRQHIIDRYGKYLNIEKIIENKLNTNSIIYIIEGTTK